MRIIGAVHFMPLVGYAGFTSYQEILATARVDLLAYQEGGVNAIILENNYNLPHQIKEKKNAVEMMQSLAKDLAKVSQIPLGISVLWNDYQSAFLMAKSCGAKFIRVPVFVDSVATSFGKIMANSKDVIQVRIDLGAQHIKILADIHVKHAGMLDKSKSLICSAKEAQQAGADALIITGKWTGDAPMMRDLQSVKEVVEIPILVGSGADHGNIQRLLALSDGVIVSTSLKQGSVVFQERNMKPFEARIDREKVMHFMSLTKKTL